MVEAVEFHGWRMLTALVQHIVISMMKAGVEYLVILIAQAQH
jgi:hypothetical protein